MFSEIELITNSSWGGSGTTYNLTDGTICKVTALRGVGIPDFEWDMAHSPTSYGGQLNALKMGPRKMSMDIVWTASSDSDAIDRREQLYRAFKPYSPSWEDTYGGEYISNLKVTRKDSSVRYIDVQTVGAVDMPLTDDDAFHADTANSGKIRVNMIAPDPTWYENLTYSYTDANLSGTSSGFFTVNIAGASWFMYPTILAGGAATSMTISHGYGGAALGLSGLSASEEIIIDTSPFKKTIKDYTTGDNKFNLLGTSSTISNFSIPPPWYVGTSNPTTALISYSVIGGDSGTYVALSYQKRFIGI